MDTVQSIFANVKSKCFNLNHSNSRKLEIYLKSIVPNINFAFKLKAVDHSCHVEFSKETWNEIVKRSEEIREIMECENIREIFSNEELRIFTEERHDQCAICFVDPQGTRVNMMIGTFKKMMSESMSISSSYKNLLQDIKNIASNMETFIDTLIAKCQQCQVENRSYLDHLSDLRNGMKELQAHPRLASLEIDYYDDYDSVEEYHNRKRRYR